MDESLRAQIDSYLSHLDGLIRRGRQLREMLAADPSDKSALVATRAWQQDMRRDDQSVVRRQQGSLAGTGVQRSVLDALAGRVSRRRGVAG